MNNKDVFISYKTEEFDEANWVRTVLETNGISCWMAPASIPGGSSYAVEIPQAIRGCKVFVLILSEKSQASKWVPRELDQAINEGKTVMPFMLENCPLKDDFNFYLTNVQRYAAFESKTAAMEKMVREIKAVLGMTGPQPTPAPQPAPAPQPVPTPQHSTPAAPASVRPTPPPDKKTAAAAPKKKKKSPLGLILAVIAAVIAVAVVLPMLTKVTVAGEGYNRSATYLSIEEKTLTVKDVQNIGKLKKLRSLHLVDCTFPEVPLSGMLPSSLMTLELRDCGLEDEDIRNLGLENIRDLGTLILAGNPVTEIPAPAGVVGSLSCIDISRTNIKDLSPLSQYKGLVQVQADGLGLTALPEMSGGLSTVKQLSLADNQLTSLQPLESCGGLQELNVCNNQLTSLTGLKMHLELQNLYASDNRLTSLQGLENTTLLERVALKGNKLPDVGVLAKSAAHLTHLDVRSNQLTTLQPLKDCARLQILYAGNNRISDISALAGKGELKEVILAVNRITDASALADCVKLQRLIISYNLLTSTAWLKDLSMDTTYDNAVLDVSHNQIAQLTMPQCKSFQYLALAGNPLPSLEALTGVSGRHLTFDYIDAATLLPLAEPGFSGYTVVGCPLDQQVAAKEWLNAYTVNFSDGTKDPLSEHYSTSW